MCNFWIGKNFTKFSQKNEDIFTSASSDSVGAGVADWGVARPKENCFQFVSFFLQRFLNLNNRHVSLLGWTCVYFLGNSKMSTYNDTNAGNLRFKMQMKKMKMKNTHMIWTLSLFSLKHQFKTWLCHLGWGRLPLVGQPWRSTREGLAGWEGEGHFSSIKVQKEIFGKLQSSKGRFVTCFLKEWGQNKR